MKITILPQRTFYRMTTKMLVYKMLLSIFFILFTITEIFRSYLSKITFPLEDFSGCKKCITLSIVTIAFLFVILASFCVIATPPAIIAGGKITVNISTSKIRRELFCKETFESELLLDRKHIGQSAKKFYSFAKAKQYIERKLKGKQIPAALRDHIHCIFLPSQRQHFWVYPSSQTLVKLFQAIDINPNSEYLMNFEWARYETFKTFPMDSTAMPTRLAANGFFYTNKEDIVMCFSCNIQYGGWKSGDVPSEIHRQLSPRCVFINSESSNMPIHASNETTMQTTIQTTQGAVGGYEELDGINSIGPINIQPQNGDSQQIPSRRHKHPEYADIGRRQKSFNGWPCDHVIKTKDLVEAGFFYAGTSDCVRCFSCGGGLRNWEYGDTPWQEHLCCFPQCDFLKEHKDLVYNTHSQASEPSSMQPNTKGNCLNETTQPSDFKKKTQETKASSEYEDGHKSMINRHTSMTFPRNTNGSLSQSKPSHLDEENIRLKSQLACKICMDRDSTVVFTPCGHMVSCEGCSERLRKCAVCRRLIKGRIRVIHGS